MPDPFPAASQDRSPAESRPQRYVFLLLERFTMVAFAAAIEPLRLANQIAGRRLYEWRLLGESGQAVACSNGTAVVVEGDPPAPIAEPRRTPSIP